MNILFVTNFCPNPIIGGIERVTNILAKYFHSQGYNCYNIYFYKSMNDTSYNYIRCENHSDQKDKQWLIDYLKTNGINIIINQSNPYYTPFLVSCSDKSTIKVVTAIHNSTELKALSFDDFSSKYNKHIKTLLLLIYPVYKLYSGSKLKWIHKKSLNLSDMTVLLSKSLIPGYFKQIGNNKTKSKVCYINNPLSFEKIIEDSALLKKDKIVLVVSRLEETQKKLSQLLNIWKRIENDRMFQNWKLIIVGDGDSLEFYKVTANHLLLKSVFFTGRQEPIPFYTKASIFAMTSIWEGLPMTLLESLQMGVVPIVMDSFPSAHDIIQDGKNGLLVNYGDIEGFYQKLVLLMNNSTFRLQLAQNAVRSSSNYSINNIGSIWLKLFDNIVNKKTM